MSNKQQSKALKQLLALAENPYSLAKRYKWLSILSTGIGCFLIFQSLIGLSENYQPVSQLVYIGIGGGFLVGLGIYFSAVVVSRPFIGPLLNKEEIQRKIEEHEQDT